MKPVMLNEIEMYNALLGFKKTHGGDAFAALLKKLQVRSPFDLDASRLDEIKMTCSLGVAGLNVVEGEDEKTGASGELTRLADAAHGATSVPQAIDKIAGSYWNRRKASSDATKDK